MKVSISLFYTDVLPHKRKLFHRIIKNKVFEGLRPSVAFKKLRETGLDGVELILPNFQKVTEQDMHEVKKFLDDCKIPVFSVHQMIRYFTKTRQQEITELFHIADALDAKVIVLHMSSVGKQVFNKEYINHVHGLQKKFGIKVGFENREKFFASLHTPHGWHKEKFADLMKDNNFDITLDTTHLAASDGDIIEFFEKNKKRIINIHLSDYKPHFLNKSLRPLRYKHLPLGKGTLPIEQFLQLLKKEKYDGLLTMEIHGDLNDMCESTQMITAALTGKQ